MLYKGMKSSMVKEDVVLRNRIRVVCEGRKIRMVKKRRSRCVQMNGNQNMYEEMGYERRVYERIEIRMMYDVTRFG